MGDTSELALVATNRLKTNIMFGVGPVDANISGKCLGVSWFHVAPPK